MLELALLAVGCLEMCEDNEFWFILSFLDFEFIGM